MTKKFLVIRNLKSASGGRSYFLTVKENLPETTKQHAKEKRMALAGQADIADHAIGKEFASREAAEQGANALGFKSTTVQFINKK